MLAPASRRTRAASSWPPRTANRNGVNASLLVFVRSSAPASIRALTAAALFRAAAHISAFWPFHLSLAFGSAPCASSTRTAATVPLRAAVINAVSPSGNAVFGSAPADSSRSMAAAFPLVQARNSGVTPYRLAAFTFAPARMRRSAVSRSSRCTARCSGVVPSGSERTLEARATGSRGEFRWLRAPVTKSARQSRSLAGFLLSVSGRAKAMTVKSPKEQWLQMAVAAVPKRTSRYD